MYGLASAPIFLLCFVGPSRGHVAAILFPNDQDANEWGSPGSAGRSEEPNEIIDDDLENFQDCHESLTGTSLID